MSELEGAKTIAVINFCLDGLIQEVWKAISAKGIEKMAPKTVNGQCDYTVQSFVYQSFTEKYKNLNKFRAQADPVPAQLDNMAVGTLQGQKSVRKLSKQLQPSLFGQRSRSLISDIEKKSVRSGKFVFNSSKQTTQKSVQKPKKESFFISLGYEEETEDKDVLKMRKIQNQQKEEELRNKRKAEERIKHQQQTALAQQKYMKDKNTITYDYEGQFYGINPSKTQNQIIQKMRQGFGNPEVPSKEFNKAEPTAIQSQRSAIPDQKSTMKSQLGKQRLQMSQKSLSIADVFGDGSKMAEGVRVTELRNGKDNLTIESKAGQKDVSKKYRLKDYKSSIKQKSFVEFPMKIEPRKKKNSMMELTLTPNEAKEDVKAKTTRLERNLQERRGNSEHEIRAAETHTILQDALGRGLPFIRTKGLRFYDLGLNNTFRTLQPGSTSRRSSKFSSRIKIDDVNLYELNMLN